MSPGREMSVGKCLPVKKCLSQEMGVKKCRSKNVRSRFVAPREQCDVISGETCLKRAERDASAELLLGWRHKREGGEGVGFDT